MATHKGLELEDAVYMTDIGEMGPNYALQEEIDAFCTAHRINPAFKPHLNQLAEYEVVMIADDSGSMNANSDANIEGVVSRWDELQLMARLLVQLYGTVNKDGLDVHFLNRPAVKNLKTPEHRRLKRAFEDDPCGATPLCDTLERVLDTAREPGKRRIIVVITDGEPTTANGMAPEIDRLERILRGRDTTMDFVAIVACTGNKRVLSFLNNWDATIPSLDVVDDFLAEREEVWRVQGRGFGFCYADYVVKLTLGAVDRYFDQLDERPVKRSGAKSGIGCCTIM